MPKISTVSSPRTSASTSRPSSNFAIFLSKILWFLLYLLPWALFFSYYPIISLGGNSSMNFELSIPLIWLVLFDLIAFIRLFTLVSVAPRQKRLSLNLPGLSDRRFFLLSLFPLFATLSVFWSKNPLRAILTAGIIWLIFFAVFAIVYIMPLSIISANTHSNRHKFLKYIDPFFSSTNFRQKLLISILASASLVSVFCFIQSLLDLYGAPRESTLLCPGCVSTIFGFPHPSGFAIEPQFMGNLLLAPTLLALYLLAFKKSTSSYVAPAPTFSVRTAKFLKFSLHFAAVLIITTLFFVFSRGAIYAFALGLIILIIFALVRHCFTWKLLTLPIAGFIIALILQGTFAHFGPTSETFTGAIAKSVHQLSLGIIDFRPQSSTDPASAPSSESDSSTSDNPASLETPETPVFDGYIAESTDIRLSLNRLALTTWLYSPLSPPVVAVGSDCNQEYEELCARFTPMSIIFGVGLGAAGTALHAAHPSEITTPKEIVQNEYLSLLLELGLVGIFLVIFGLLVAFFPHIFPARFIDGRHATAKAVPDFWRHPALPLLCALIIAYLATLLFFSGLPNALQIYLMPPLLYLIFQTQNLAKSSSSSS